MEQRCFIQNPMDGGAWWASVHGIAESDTTEWLHFYFSLLCIGEGNGNPLQCSCLKRLSSSSSSKTVMARNVRWSGMWSEVAEVEEIDGQWGQGVGWVIYSHWSCLSDDILWNGEENGTNAKLKSTLINGEESFISQIFTELLLNVKIQQDRQESCYHGASVW